VDEDVLAMRVCSAVAEVVQRQAEVGVTVLNDGEQGKPGYSTYMKDRLTGFEGESTAAAVSGEAKDFRRTPPGAREEPSPGAPRAPGPSLGKIGTPRAGTLKTCRPLSKKSKPKRYS
jgi:5-methyltetrahydropteroyltriglutamate--homocysteine methyltransferase